MNFLTDEEFEIYLANLKNDIKTGKEKKPVLENRGPKESPNFDVALKNFSSWIGDSFIKE